MNVARTPGSRAKASRSHSVRSPTTVTAIGRERATQANAASSASSAFVRRLDAYLQRGVAALRHGDHLTQHLGGPISNSRSSASTLPRVTRSRTFCAVVA